MRVKDKVMKLALGPMPIDEVGPEVAWVSVKGGEGWTHSWGFREILKIMSAPKAILEYLLGYWMA